jgi:glycosyltransferase involved in cell wall biosynthesis
MNQSISVVIPLYNKAQYIARALKSVLKQSLVPFEIIVVDDGSTDGGGNLVMELGEPRIRLISQENQGVSSARNRGINEAQGDLIAFLDADDIWKPKFLETILKLRQKFPQAGAYATAYERVTQHKIHYYPKFPILPLGVKEGLINYIKTAKYFPLCSSAVVVPKTIFAKIGGFHECPIRGEDVDMWLRIALRYPVAWSSYYGAIYFENTTFRSVHVKWQTEEPIISRTAREAIQSGQVSGDDISDLKEYVASFQLKAARRCLVMGDFEKALQLLSYCKDTKELYWKWQRLSFMAKLPFNLEYWLWKTTVTLKELIPGLLYWKNKILLRNLIDGNNTI